MIAIFRQREAIGIQQSEFLIMFMLFVQCPKEVIVRLNFAFVWEWLSKGGEGNTILMEEYCIVSG